jgi:hypothetical protein
VRPTEDILSTIAATWIIFGIVCAALPFTHAVPSLQFGGTFGDLGPFFAALIVGLVAGGPLSFAARRLSGAGVPTNKTNNMWATLTAKSAMWLGIVGWGLPIGIAFVVDEFLRTKQLFVLLPNAVIWPVAGIGFGLAMRWLAMRRDTTGRQ